MTRIFVCFDCGDIPCVLRVPDDCEMSPLCCPFFEPDGGLPLCPPWREARPVQSSEPSPIIEVD